MSFLNLITPDWINKSEQKKDLICFQLGGIKNCQDIRSIFDNWEF